MLQCKHIKQNMNILWTMFKSKSTISGEKSEKLEIMCKLFWYTV